MKLSSIEQTPADVSFKIVKAKRWTAEKKDVSFAKHLVFEDKPSTKP